MAEPSKSFRGRLKEGVWDFCEIMADVDAGRRNRYDGIPQQLQDANNERRRLSHEAPKAKEQGHQKNSDDAGSGEHHDDKVASKVDERRKNKGARHKTTEQYQKLRKDKAVDTGAAHGNRKLQKNLRGHGKPHSTLGKTLKCPESSSEEELQWTTDRMILGDLDEVPVGRGPSKIETPRPSNATEQPSLRLRGGAGGARRKFAFRSLDDEDHHNALREEARDRVRDRSQDQHVRSVDNKFAGEPHRNPPTGYNLNAGPRATFGFGPSARIPPFGAEKINQSGNQRLGFGASLNSKNTSGIRGAGVKFKIVNSSDEGSDSERSSHEKGKGKYNGRRRPRSPSRSPSPTRTRNHGRRRDHPGRRTSKAARDEDSSSSDENLRNDSGEEGSEGSFEKGKGRYNGRRRPRSPSRSPSPARTRNHGRRRDYPGRRTSKAARDRDSSSSSDENLRNDSGEEGSEASFESANGVMDTKPPDYYAVLQLSPSCSAQDITEAAKKMRIKTHPDRLKKANMSVEEMAKIDETAGNVGQAAEVLSDPEKLKRREYDRLVKMWERKYGNRQR
ncbi:hypothetical protein MMC07_009072 [Pseudocyphellaria aurata]|nr:hypothetical protein [Pseudocyphellaria aurata]